MAFRDRVADFISTQNNSNSENKSHPDAFDGFERPRSNDAIGFGIAADNVNVEKTREFKEDAIFRRIKNSPEIISIMQAVVDDILGSGIKRYEYVGRTDNAENPGKRSVEEAKRFYMQNKEVVAEFLIDTMAVGDGYMYKKGLDEDEAKSQIKEYVKSHYDLSKPVYEEKAAEMLLEKSQDEIEGTRELQIVPASSVEHDIDDFGNIERYIQNVNGEEFHLDPEKIVHTSYLNLNGRTYGFTPVAALFAELDMLANAKDYNGVRFDNAAVPNKVFKLPDDGPEGQNFEMVKETVKKYRKLKNKHRDLVLTGNVEIEDLNDTNDVEFKELIQLVQRILVMAWGVPPSRVGGVMGQSGAKESAMAQEGYNKRIKRMQDKYQTLLNNEIFEPKFNVRVEFENPDIKSEIRRAEKDLRKTEVVKQQLALGLMNSEEARDYLGKRSDQIAQDMDSSDMRERARQMGSSQEDMDSSVSTSAAEDAVNPNMNPENDSTVENQ